MYKHILLPTDGSALSEDAARAGIELARRIGARITALHVVARPAELGLDGWMHGDKSNAEHLAAALERHGALYVETVREEALKSGVPCEAAIARGDAPEKEIVHEAATRGCDLIVMASHGHKGADGVLLASVTLAVATLGGIPVLIHHAQKDRPRPAAKSKRAAASEA